MPPPCTLLICTVGGSPEPIVATLKHWRPSRALFLPSRQTRPDVEAKILPLARQGGVALDVGAYDFIELPDPQDFTASVRKMRDLVPEVDGREKSPLTARNPSILAHGFDPVSDKLFQSLWDAVLCLAGVEEAALPALPRLGRV
jgi:hypothetical protein